MSEIIEGPYQRLAVLAGFSVDVCPTCGRNSAPSVRTLAAKLGVHFTLIQRVKTRQLSLRSMTRLAASLGMTLGQLVDTLWPNDSGGPGDR